MRKHVLTALSMVCLAACLAGCHRPRGKYLEFTITPDAAAKTVTLKCTGSSSGKCGFGFAGTHPSDVVIDVGNNATVLNVETGTPYCSGTFKPLMDKCTKYTVPDHEAEVKKENGVVKSGGS